MRGKLARHTGFALAGLSILLVLAAGLFWLQTKLIEPAAEPDATTDDEDLVDIQWIYPDQFDAFVRGLAARKSGDFFDPDSVRIRSDQSPGLSFASALAPRTDALELLSMLQNGTVAADDFPSLAQGVAVARMSSGDIRGGTSILGRYPEFLDAACIGVDTPLTWSIRSGNYEAFRSILRLGANVNTMNKDSVPPLVLAASHDHDPRFALDLLDEGADISARLPRDGATALHDADTPEVVQALVSRGVDVNATDSTGHTPLHLATTPEVVTALVNLGASVNAESRFGLTPLHFAATPEVAAALLALGADVNARNRDGDTPLHLALTRGVALVRVLIEGGADVQAKNKSGKTPLMSLDPNPRRRLRADEKAELRTLLQAPPSVAAEP